MASLAAQGIAQGRLLARLLESPVVHQVTHQRDAHGARDRVGLQPLAQQPGHARVTTLPLQHERGGQDVVLRAVGIAATRFPVDLHRVIELAELGEQVGLELHQRGPTFTTPPQLLDLLERQPLLARLGEQLRVLLALVDVAGVGGHEITQDQRSILHVAGLEQALGVGARDASGFGRQPVGPPQVEQRGLGLALSLQRPAEGVVLGGPQRQADVLTGIRGHEHDLVGR